MQHVLHIRKHKHYWAIFRQTLIFQIILSKHSALKVAFGFILLFMAHLLKLINYSYSDIVRNTGEHIYYGRTALSAFSPKKESSRIKDRLCPLCAVNRLYLYTFKRNFT